MPTAPPTGNAPEVAAADPRVARAGGVGVLATEAAQPPMSADARADDPAWFAAPACRNCGTAFDTPFCPACGQKRATRLGVRDLGREAWERWRVFEFDAARSGWRLVTGPGRVARDYVLGARKRHVHPLKLLLIAIACLIVVQNTGGYLRHGGAEMAPVFATLQRWANWSFSLGIVAMLASSLLLFPRRFGYNAIEHMVLAAYCQCLVIGLSVLNLLPTLVWNDPGFLRAHRGVAPLYLHPLGALLVGVALAQFFGLDLRRDGWRVVVAVAAYLAIDWVLVKLFSRAIVRLVMADLPS